MKSVNKVILIGNLTRDPEITQVNATTDVARFSLAVNESYKKPDGTMVDNTTFIDCEAWSGLAKVAGNYLKKGSKIYVEGNIRVDQWQDADSGKTRSKYKVRVQDLVMLDGRGGGESGGGNSFSKQSSGGEDIPTVNAVDDDELPF